MPEQREILLTNLLLDLENPRLAAGQENQVQTIHAMLRAEGPKTLALADSIAAEGLSPMERFLVMPSPENSKRFIVLEGNRRVTALRILGEPTIADGGLTPAQQSKLQKASVLYRKRGELDRVECVVFATRKEANPWIERRHRGDQGGLGIVRWGATESERFDARNSGKGSPALQVLDYVAEHGALDGATRAKLHDVSITNLKRLVADKSVREALGLDLDSKGRMLTRFPQAEVLKGLTRLIQDLAHEKIKVSDIYHATDRKNYISGFKSSERPSASKALGSATPLIGPGAPPGSSSAATAGRLVKEAKPRLNLIPRTCPLRIGVPKLARIATELRTLRLDRYPNGTSVLLRVFIELSVDALIEKHSLMSEAQAKGSKLRNKLTKAAEFLETNGRLTHKQGNAVRKAATDKHLLASSVTTLHEYLHNKDLAASPTELRTAWDNLEPFLRAIWP